MCRWYYKENKEKILKMAQDQCNALFEEKNKKREYGKRRYWNMSEEDKYKLKEYGRNTGKIV